jgi:hypothetical protein
MFGGVYGAFGTSGRHTFDETSPSYVRIAALLDTRRKYATLRRGQLWVRPTRNLRRDFGPPTAGDIAAWSRIQDAEEILCVVNTDGKQAGSADVAVDPTLNRRGEPMTVVTNTMQAERPRLGAYDGPMAGGTRVPVTRISDDRAFVSINNLGPSEVVILANTPHLEDTELGRVAQEYQYNRYSSHYSGYPGRKK